MAKTKTPTKRTPQARKDRIARMAEAKKNAPKYATYWLTQRGDLVEVWIAPPRFDTYTRTWKALDPFARVMTADGVKEPFCCVWTREYTLKECRVAPDTIRECIRVGNAEPNYVAPDPALD